MFGPLLAVIAASMLALVLVPGVRTSVNPIYIGGWIALNIGLGAMGLFYVAGLMK